MAANPFLFSEEPYTSPNSSSSNPFLLDDDFNQENEFIDNPFLSQTATTISTNPFNLDPMDLEPLEAEMPNISSDPFRETINRESFFTNTNDNLNPLPIITSTFSENEDKSALPQKPSELNLKYSHQGFGNGPPRPPPPRPPQSKETQDLLMSVMGAMDATSTTLLDKIPPTRTPSPVSMRDLHSPSPTPDPNIDYILDVSDKSYEIPNSDNVDLFSSFKESNCDINQNPAIEMKQETLRQQNIKPPRPLPPARPPKPPENKYESALFNESSQHEANDTSLFSFSQLPVEEKNHNIDEDMYMFGLEESQQKNVATNADILNLYNTPKQEPIKPDLLFDTVESDIVMQQQTDLVSSEVSESTPYKDDMDVMVSPMSQSNDIMKDNIISEHFQGEIPEHLNASLSIPSSGNIIDSSASEENYIPIINSQGTDLIEDDFNPRMEIQGAHNPVNFYTNTDPFGSFEIPKQEVNDDFDEFSKKFDSARTEDTKNEIAEMNNAWGSEFTNTNEVSASFEHDDGFDAFLALQEPPSVPQSSPLILKKSISQESEEDKDFSVFIRPKSNLDLDTSTLPTIAPPPATISTSFVDTSPRFNPFDNQNDISTAEIPTAIPYAVDLKRTDSQETPPTPLYDEDVSQPLEPFPRTNYPEECWEMQLRQPNKKKITGQRFWKKIFVKILHQTDCILLQLFNQNDDKDPFQELPLQPCYSVSEIGAQQYDQFGKIFTLKLQYIFYKERPGVRPGQVKKAERITNKLSQFAAYAIQGDYQGVKEFGSDLKKLGLPVEHAPQVSQLMKLGSLNYEDLKQFSFCIEEALFKLTAHRDRALHYKMEEVQITAVDELYVEQDAEGHVEKQIARVRLFFLGFLTGMPDVELGVNDMRRQGKEVVGRHDIIPVVTEEWIRLEEVEFHSCIQQSSYHETHIIRFKPPDACYIELMRFRVRPPKNRELPLQLKAQICVMGYKVELRADVLVPGFASRKLGQIPCEDVMIRFPIPECWIYLFRVEKHFRYGSVKSAHRRTGKIKGIERILGTVDSLQENLIEVTSGQAKYEHQHRAIVWRCPRLPKEGQGAYTTHNMVCKIALTNYDQMPEKFAEYCYVEFTMPATQVSHTTCRSVSLQNSDSDDPPEKYVRYLARHEYRVGIEHTEGEAPNPYAAATFVSKPTPVSAPTPVEVPAVVPEESSSDTD